MKSLNLKVFHEIKYSLAQKKKKKLSLKLLFLCLTSATNNKLL